MEINDFAPFAALSIGQAKEIIAGIVHDAISDAKQKAQPTQESQAEVMNIDDAVVFLKENGLPITKKSLSERPFPGQYLLSVSANALCFPVRSFCNGSKVGPIGRIRNRTKR